MGATFHTPDFARSWSPADDGGMGAVYALSIQRSGFGLAAGTRGVGVTRDAGRSWALRLPGVNPRAVAIGPDGSAIAGCEGGIVHITDDAGVSWRSIGLGWNGEPLAIRFTSATSHRILLSSIVPDPAVAEQKIREAAYFIWKGSLQRSSADDDWFRAERSLSRRSALLRSDDAGKSWSVEWAPRGLNWIALDGCDDLLAVLSDDGRISWRRGARTAWEERALPAPSWAMWLPTVTTWLCPADYDFLRTEDAGAHWARLSPSLNLIGGTQFVSSRRGFTTSGNYGGTFSVAETNDAGATWTLVHAYDQGRWRFSDANPPAPSAPRPR
jgi:photosystem II stability/assembly factor-like uncharacterized protein